MFTLPRGRAVLALDALMAVWAIAWILAGVAVADTVGGLTNLTGAFRSVGGAVEGVGETLGSVQVPLLGGPLDRASGAITAAGRDIVVRGAMTRDDIEQASFLLGAMVALIPILTLLLPYVPARAARASEAAALRELLPSGGAIDPDLERFLANRALTHVPYRRLARLGPRPWETELAATRRSLVEEELRRLGVSPRRLGDRRTPRSWGAPEEPPP